jgi:hypothetical protein
MSFLRYKDVPNWKGMTLISIPVSIRAGFFIKVQSFSIIREYETHQTPFPAINQLVTKDFTVPELELH